MSLADPPRSPVGPRPRIQLWSCGGGRQSAGIAALIVQGKLPKPDHVAMVALEWEVRSVWPYVNTYIKAAMESLGIPFTAIPRAKYGTKTFWGGIDDQIPMMPVYTNKSGERAKLSEFCSGYWKRDVMTRWAAEQDGWKETGVDNWVGISFEERRRRGVPRRQWFRAVYPLLDVRPTTVSGCLAAVAAVGWPAPPRSRCRHCPNQSDGEWAELTPEEWDAACALEDKIRAIDSHAFFHKTLIPLREVRLNPADENGGLFGGCTAGTCY
jgi:hypothetical protein